MITIRLAQPDDAALIAKLDAQARTDFWSISQIQAELAFCPAINLILEDNDIPAGFALSRRILDELEIDMVAIIPGYRRQGLGRQLVDHLINLARSASVNQIFLEVAATNSTARALYRTVGFKQIDIRRNYYAHTGDDAVVLCYTLKPFI